MKLNLACGEKKLAGWVNHDLYVEADRRFDLEAFPWPVESGSCEAVAMWHYLEHVGNVETTIRELHRILKLGGELWIKVPHHRNPYAPYIFHKWLFSRQTFDQFTMSRPYFLKGDVLFETISLRHTFPVRRGLRWLETVANIAPYWWEWCQCFPCVEVEWKARKL